VIDPLPDLCPCGSGTATATCCLPYITRKAQPPTAEALMRARYSAYVLQEIDYVLDTHAPESREGVDRASTEAWSKNAVWRGLEIKDKVAGGPKDETGVVEFIARYDVKEQELSHHERSTFRKIDGAWLYADGEMVKAKPVRREEPKVGRNDPCPCGSSKKYKKCHGAAA
jgi:SEC-C motif-containing protein